jgi:ABC-type glycerol-3-phosphate transport system substrate-binding protein
MELLDQANFHIRAKQMMDDDEFDDMQDAIGQELDALAKKFEAEYPNIKIDWNWV